MSSKPQSHLYSPLPPENPPAYVVLPATHRIFRRNLRRNLLSAVSTAVLLSALFFFLYPSDPTLQLARIKLNNIQIKSKPSLSLDLSLALTLRVRNRDFFSLDYESLNVGIGYRGRELGFVESKGGRVRARGESYVDAKLDLDGFEVMHDLVYLIEDVAAGMVPFDTVSKVRGEIGLFLFKIPIQAKMACEVHINPANQTIMRQNCYPD